MEANKNITPEAQEAANDAQVMHAKAQNIVITDQSGYEAAAGDLAKIKTQSKALTNKRKAITVPMDDAKKAVMNFFRPPTEYLDDAERTIKRAMLAYSQEQERLRQAEQRKRDEIERKRREEFERQQREEQRKRDEAERLRLADIERKRKEHEAAALALAEEAEAAGDSEGAAEMLEEAVAPAYVEPPYVAPAYVEPAYVEPPPAPIRSEPKAAGVSQRDNWKGRVTDPMALIKAVVEGKAPQALLQSNQSTIGQMAKATKGSVSYPGVEFYNDPIISSRSN